MKTRTGERIAAAAGALYAVLLVTGDDVINPAGEPPEPGAPLREVSTYLDQADASGFWLGRSIGLLGVCALLVFVVYLSRTIRRAEREPGILSGLVLASGAVAVALQLLAAPAQFAAVQAAADGVDPRTAQALLHASVSFQLSFLPLALCLGAVAAAGLSLRVLPRWLALTAAALGLGLAAGMIGNPQDPSTVAFMAFALCLLWFPAASAVLVRRVERRPTTRDAPRAAALAGGLVVLALATGIIACGDDEDEDETISKADYIAKSADICASSGSRANSDFKRLVEGEPRTAATAQRFVSESVVPLFRRSVSRRERLPAPEGDEREIEAMMAAGRKALAGFERAAATPSLSLSLMQGKTADPATDFDTRSRRYGIKECGGD